MNLSRDSLSEKSTSFKIKLASLGYFQSQVNPSKDESTSLQYVARTL